MSPAERRVLGFGDTNVAVASDEPADVTWLEEFLCPWFEERTGDAKLEVALVRDGTAYEASLARGPLPGPPVPAFRADGAPLVLEPWQDGTGGSVAFDRRSEAFVVASAERRSFRVVARPGARFARIVWMRIVRELALERHLALGRPVLHAAAAACAGRGIAFGGPKKSGKSSCLLHALRAPGAALVANDRVALVPSDGAWTARGMPTIVRLRAGSLELHPEVAARLRAAEPEVSNALGEETAGQPRWPRAPGSAGLSPAQLRALLGVPALAEARLAAIVLPRLSHEPGSFALARLDPARAADRLGGALLFATPQAETLCSPPDGGLPATPVDADALTREVAWIDCRLDLGAFEADPAALVDGILDLCD